ncbi:GAF domain-containing protein [Shouchella sp. 1P01AA]|uniref:GAF domain-containing protein n=1 Tax=Shouchella sp. 1P01AA TaxID=3132301 RepID=UPI0039A1B448
MNHETLLLDASRAFLKAQGMNEILSVLTRSVAALVKDADMVLVYTYDHDKQVLQLTRGEGDISHQLYQVAFCPGESITGFVYMNQTTMLLRQPSDVEQAMANMSASNRLSYLAGVSHQTVHSSFSIPIIINDSCIATLTANRLTHPTPFTEKDLELVMELLDYAKFALEKEIQMQHATFVINDYQIKVEAKRYFQQALSESGDADHVVRLLRRRLPNGSVYLSEHPIHQHHSTPIRFHQQHTEWLVYTNQPHQTEAIYLEEAASAIGLLRTFEYQKIEEDLLKDEKEFADSLENHHYDLAFWDMPSNTPVVCLVMCGSKGNQLKEYQTLQKLFVDLQHRWKLIFYKGSYQQNAENIR